MEKEFNIFIKKWCGNDYPHLIDSDENDGERFREKLRNLISKQKVKAILINRVNPKVEPWRSLLEELGLCNCVGEKERCDKCA